MKWIALSLTLLLWAVTWPQILPPEADLPPCHMMGAIALAGGWTLVEFAKARKAKKRMAAPPRCTRCGHVLMGGTGEPCPQCGERITGG